MANKRMSERFNVGTRRGTERESFFNPADYFQFFRREGIRPNPRTPAGYGFYQGKPEFSMGFAQRGTPTQIAQIKQKAMKRLGQESVYGESKRGYSLAFTKGGITARYKYRIRIFGGRRLADSGYPRDVYRYQTLQRAISDEKSSSYLFSGGTVFEDGNDIVITSAEFDEKNLPMTRQRIRMFLNRLSDSGFPARADVEKRR